MRIISLLSSATEMLYELGLGEQLVAISHECDYPPEALRQPRVSKPRFDPAGLGSGEIDAAVRRAMEEHGSVYEIDVAALRELNPDLILTQAVCEVCAVPTGSVEEAVSRLPRAPEVLSLDAHTIEQIITSIEDVATAAGTRATGVEVAGRLRARLDEVADAVEHRPRPRALLLEWLDPPFAPGHWVPEMVERAGGDNLVGTAGERSKQIDWIDLAALDPDCLLIEPCGYDLSQARADADAHRARLESVGARAIRAERAWLLHSSYFSRSGPRVVDGVEALARVLHPSALPNTPPATIAARWP
jgi:iron complex transport system substrate-binding protein